MVVSILSMKYEAAESEDVGKRNGRFEKREHAVARLFQSEKHALEELQ